MQGELPLAGARRRPDAEGIAGGRREGAAGPGNGGRGREGERNGTVAAPLTAARRLRWTRPSRSTLCSPPRLNFPRPFLFSTQSPAEVRPELAGAARAEALAWLPCSAEAAGRHGLLPQIRCQPRAVSPSLSACPAHAELRLWLLPGMGCVFTSMMAPASLI